MSNYKTLFSLRVLQSILKDFTDSFLVLYFLQVSDNNILPIGIYKLISVIVIFLTVFSLRNLSKSKHRSNIMRIGIIFDFIYFLTIIILKEKIANYSYILGILYGLKEGFYFSVYNILESDGISNEERAKFQGEYTAVKAISSIVFPLIFGNLIYEAGFVKSLLVVLIIVFIRIFVSFMFKDTKIPKVPKSNLKGFIKVVKGNEQIKQVYKMLFFNGITYSEGAFTYIVMVYIIKVFSNSISLGIFTSIFSLISCLLGFLFAKVINKRHYIRIIKVSMFFTISSLCLMIFRCNMFTIVLLNFCQTFSRGLMDLINCNSQFNVSNLNVIGKEFKSEYWIGCEAVLVIGRALGHIFFICMAFTANIIYIFIIFLILLTINSIKLQKVVSKNVDTD